MLQRTIWSIGIPLVALAACAMVAGQGSGGMATPPADPCPHNFEWHKHKNGPMYKNIDQFTGGRDNVPEYNDCQKFIEGSLTAPKYTDAVFALFMADRLTSSDFRLGKDYTAVALIKADAAYAPLKIKAAGFYCLGLKEAPLQAALLDAGPQAQCNEPLDWTGAESLNAIKRSNKPNGSSLMAGDIPPVVRWGFDPRGWKQYATIPCGVTHVCYVGPDGFFPQPLAATLAALGLPAAEKQMQVDGWSDDQFLAATETSPETPMLWGGIVPDKQLASYDKAAYNGEWIPVASVAMTANSAKYVSRKLGMTVDGAYNGISACYTDSAGTKKCDFGPVATPTCSPSPDGNIWYTQHRLAGTTEYSYHCVEYIPVDPEDQDLQIPGTVRWRWSPDDEMAWFRCPDGCCKEAD